MYKFEIIKTIPITKNVDLPRYILAESQEKAEKIYKNFSNMLNKMAYRYSQITGLEKADLFGEAVLGLAEAYKTWSEISTSSIKKTHITFKMHANFFIKDYLNEYIRHNVTSVKIPSYLMKAINNFRKFKNELNTFNITDKEIELLIVNNNLKTINTLITKNVYVKVSKILKNLNSAAERASITIKELYDRSNLISFYTEELNININNNLSEESINTAILINDLKTKMNDNELLISNYIMDGYTIIEIGKLMGKSTHWVRYQLKKFKDKVLIEE